jgi:CheY-like chemotaxis protein
MNQVMEARFRKFGCEIETFVDANQALEALRTRRPQLLIVDLDLGEGLSGFDLIDAIRTEMHFTFPIIVVTAETDNAKVAHALEIGATDYVVKPPFRFKFEEKVAEYIEAERLALHTPIPLKSVKKEAQSASLTFPISLNEVNPMGFTLLSPHLIRKGTTFTLSGATIGEIIPSKSEVMVSVLGSTVRMVGEERRYEIRVEVDSSDQSAIQDIKEFLIKSKPKSES